MRFDNQRALISGAAGDLGRACTLALAERGATLVLVDRPEAAENMAYLRQSLATLGCEPRCISLDLADSQAVAAMAEEVLAEGPVDLLLNSAGIRVAKPFGQLTLADWRAQMAVDLDAAFLLTQAFWPGMLARKYGRVLMMSAATALFGDPDMCAYGSAKAALLGLTASLAKEGAEHNVHVNSLSALAATSMTAGHLAPQVQELFPKELCTAAMLFLLGCKAPSGHHLQAAGGSISELCLAEYRHLYLLPEQRTPEILAQRWGDITRAYPVLEHGSGEEQTLALARRAAREMGVSID
ncbi:SDR family oxidoreductase [Shewanella cyperi]|uniref:SDR family oxidoreductase n=1 Tax=Shewanella cyperi TaxID=2814292 RepID=A0A974XMI1_9GAMM|nr:SDR family oxidoreductase [Shewanella cyperi]QSX31131.1 SDR family oxidoreductase [Shewanella cyperi]